MSSIVDTAAPPERNRSENSRRTEFRKAQDFALLDETSFRRTITIERKRTERSRKPVLLMLVDAGSHLQVDKRVTVLKGLCSTLSRSTRDTDVFGWYKSNAVVGVLFTEINVDEHGAILSTMMHRVSQTLQNSLNLKIFSQLTISFHAFPEIGIKRPPRLTQFFIPIFSMVNVSGGLLLQLRD